MPYFKTVTEFFYRNRQTWFGTNKINSESKLDPKPLFRNGSKSSMVSTRNCLIGNPIKNPVPLIGYCYGEAPHKISWCLRVIAL